METKVMERYFFFGLLLTTLIFSFMIFRPFWVVLFLGMAFSIVLYPIYEWLRGKRLPNFLASLLTVLFFVIALCGPLFGIGALIFGQSQDVYKFIVDKGNPKPFLDSIENAVNNFLPSNLSFNAEEKAADAISYLSKNIASIFSSTLSAFFSFVLMLLVMFYFLKDGTRWKKAIIVLSPLGDKDDEKIIHRLTLAVNGVIMGILLIGLVQGILMGIGLWIFGVPNPALWGVVAAFTSMLPTIGTALVSVPAIIFLFVTGASAPAIGLLIWAVIVVGMVDNFLAPIVVGGKINIPPLLILFSILGGISLLGPAGILVGPLTISLLYTLISIYRNEFSKNAQNIPV